MDEEEREQAYERDPRVLHTSMSDCILALSVEAGHCFSFRGPSAHVWELLKTPITAGEAAGALVRKYDIEEEECRALVSAHFSRLEADGLIVPAARDRCGHRDEP